MPTRDINHVAGSGIQLGTPFSLFSANPIDLRTVVADKATRNAISYTYNGLEVLVLDENVKYRCTKDGNAGTTDIDWNMVEGPQTGMTFKGVWNAKDNTPDLTATGTGSIRASLVPGMFYKVGEAYTDAEIALSNTDLTEEEEAAGVPQRVPVSNVTLDTISNWKVGDWAVYTEVDSVDGQGNAIKVNVFQRIGSGESTGTGGGLDNNAVIKLINQYAIRPFVTSGDYKTGAAVYYTWNQVVSVHPETGEETTQPITDVYVALKDIGTITSASVNNLSHTSFDASTSTFWKRIMTDDYNNLKNILKIDNNAGALSTLSVKTSGAGVLLDAAEVDRRIQARSFPNLDGGDAATTHANVGTAPVGNQFPA
jgi:hypothetical protein